MGHRYRVTRDLVDPRAARRNNLLRVDDGMSELLVELSRMRVTRVYLVVIEILTHR
mgnify:CR=1 FL=1